MTSDVGAGSAPLRRLLAQGRPEGVEQLARAVLALDRGVVAVEVGTLGRLSRRT
jgi:hypothetical protein